MFCFCRVTLQRVSLPHKRDKRRTYGVLLKTRGARMNVRRQAIAKKKITGEPECTLSRQTSPHFRGEKIPATGSGSRDEIRSNGSGRNEVFDGVSLFDELADGGIDLGLAKLFDWQSLDDFPFAILDGADRHRGNDTFFDAVGAV